MLIIAMNVAPMNDTNQVPSQEEGQLFPRPFRLRSIRWALAAGALALALLPFADHTYNRIYNFLCSLPLDEFFSTTAQYACPTTIVTLVFCIFLLDAPKRKYVPYLLAALLFGWIGHETIKQVSGRARPERSVRINDEGSRKILRDAQKYILSHPETPMHIEPRDQWLFMKPGRPWFNSLFSSFPSGHSNAIFCVAAFLTVIYSRGRILWFVLAAGCAFARVRYRRHFPEDVLFGGAMGWVVAQWVFSWRWPLLLGEKIENRYFVKNPSSKV